MLALDLSASMKATDIEENKSRLDVAKKRGYKKLYKEKKKGSTWFNLVWRCCLPSVTLNA